jgi:hypothetical protein
MKTSTSVATLLLAASSAAGAGAILPSPYQGSDALYWVTQDAITAVGTVGAANAYVGGGSDIGQSALVENLQSAAPMSRMLNEAGGLCARDASDATGIVIGLDAIDVIGSLEQGGNPATCNNPNGGGLLSSGGGFANYKQLLALLYGGEPNANGVQDCNTPNRQALVNSWSHLFQNGCANSEPACNDATHGGKLWHAFRPDDASGAASLFAAILGLSPSPSASTFGGFGQSPYCNAMNWDATSANANCALGPGLQFVGPGGVAQGACATNGICSDGTFCSSTTSCGNGSVCQPHAPCWLGYTGGVCGSGNSSIIGTKCPTPDGTTVCDNSNGPATVCMPQCGTVNGAPDSCVDIETARSTGRPLTTHRRPPLGTWGDNPDPNGGAGNPPPGTQTRSADVFPTSYQDNDPIRRPCIGITSGSPKRAGEEVCNIDGTLGLVIPLPSTDFLLKVAKPVAGLQQFPTVPANNTGNVALGPSVHNCARRLNQARGGTRHGGQCPNGDAELISRCQTPTDDNATLTPHGTSQVLSVRAQASPTLRNIRWDGRVFNLFMFDGTAVDGKIGYAVQTMASEPPNATGIMCADGSACPSPGTAGTACADGSTCQVRISLDFTGAFNRIHSVESVPAGLCGCQMRDATDQMGCLVHADRCSIGYAGNAATSWASRGAVGVCSLNCAPCSNVGQPCSGVCQSNGVCSLGGAACTPAGSACSAGTCNAAPATSDNAALLIGNVAPSTGTVQLLGTPGEYPLSRKLYLNSLRGFGSTSFSPDEQALAHFEADGGNITPILVNAGYFGIGGNGPNGPDTPFCEDFNQATVCGAPSNDNACTRNPAGIPTDTSTDGGSGASTVCGNGVVEAFEECDPAAPPDQWHCSVPDASTCSLTCRC